MKRICIYLTYDKQKIVDRYIGFMLKELKTCVEYLVVVCNMEEVTRGVDILDEYADCIFYRKNIGFDAGGFKDALCSFIGWKRVLEYEELILVNDSFFGPFESMKKIFLEMGNKKIDFWGLSKHGAYDEPDILKFPEHIQTYFLAIRSEMLHDIEFQKYWENMPFYKKFRDVIVQHEMRFTSYFSKMGYSYDVLADIEINNSRINIANNYSQYSMISYELLRKRKFPFLKKQPLAWNTLSAQTQENLCQALCYIDKKTDYDINLIWENIIRTFNIADLQRSLHLQYIIPKYKKERIKEKSVLIIVVACYKEAVEYVIEYLRNLKKNKNFSIQILSKDEDILENYKKEGIIGSELLVNNKYELDTVDKYDYVCVLHDTDMTSDINPSCTQKSYFYCIWENLLKDENHVFGILEKFEKEEKLGLLAPPHPNFANHFGELGEGWKENYNEVKKIIKELKINCIVSPEISPFRITNDFWIRGAILKWGKKLRKSYMKYASSLWSYFAQDMGYYSGIVESIDYASMNEVNMKYYLEKLCTVTKETYGRFDYFHEMKEYVLAGTFGMFCAKYSRILVYGIGYYAQKYKNMIPKVEAYIVSDGQKKFEYFESVPVKYISEIEKIAECGIILCMCIDNQKQVFSTLKKYGIKNYFCVPE